MAIKILTVCLFVSFIEVAYMQQCQQITVCGNDATGTANGGKGDIGAPGKAGAPGSKGSKGSQGDVGEKGERGEACALGGFEEEMRRELAEIKALVTAAPMSCSSSSVYGRQTLHTGEEAFCEGGWQVFQRRFDGSVSFDKNWTSYKNGFGDFNGEFWLGLDKIHTLTEDRDCRLEVDLWSFDDEHAFAQYSSFSVEDESNSYRLHATGYSGTAGDGLGRGRNGIHHGQRFSTWDRDNDNHNSYGCSASGASYTGGWWFDACHHATPNAAWGESQGRWRNIIWHEWKGANVAMKKTTMKMRCD